MVDRKDEGIGARYFDNTIAYHDKLPADIKKMVLTKYDGFKIDKVVIRPKKKGGTYYDVDLENETTGAEIELKIDEAGVIFEEEKQE